jgi:hypothetical protein
LPRTGTNSFIIKGLGEFIFSKPCSGYGNSVAFQIVSLKEVNNIDKCIISPISLEYDCFETVVSRQVLNDLQLDIPLRNILTHDNDLQPSSDKVSEVETMFNENHGN